MKIPKTLASITLAVFAALVTQPAPAQNQPTTQQAAPGGSPKQDDPMKQLIALSRPGENHKLLASLVGTWHFTGKQLPPKSLPQAKLKAIGGTMVRKPLYEGRFFIVEQTSADNIQMPVADGKVKEVPYQGMQIEGYDNVRQKFVTASIGNHIGSDISISYGTYDPATKTISYDAEEEVLPGMKQRVRQLMKILDADHYELEWYLVHDGQEEKVTEISCTRAKGG